MQGILIVDKPAGFTSFDVVAKLRGICKTRKIGHGGTLDPMATGVLPVFVGSAAKAVDMQERAEKEYVARMKLGARTDTGDSTGAVIETRDVPVSLDTAALRAALPHFLGNQMQTPPMYSAVKVNGVPLYKAARAGRTVERKARPVCIHELECLGQTGENEYELRILCSKGTYVRVLIEDIAAHLGTAAHMTALRRTAAGPYRLADAHTLDEIQAARDEGTLEELMLSVETVFAHLPAVEVSAGQRRRLENGAPVRCAEDAPARVRILADGRFLGVGRTQGGELRAEKLFAEREGSNAVHQNIVED